MTYEQESQLADFSNAILYTAEKYPDYKVVQILDHAWIMTKKLYSYLTIQDKKFFLRYINTSKLPV